MLMRQSVAPRDGYNLLLELIQFQKMVHTVLIATEKIAQNTLIPDLDVDYMKYYTRCCADPQYRSAVLTQSLNRNSKIDNTIKNYISLQQIRNFNIKRQRKLSTLSNSSYKHPMNPLIRVVKPSTMQVGYLRVSNIGMQVSSRKYTDSSVEQYQQFRPSRNPLNSQKYRTNSLQFINSKCKTSLEQPIIKDLVRKSAQLTVPQIIKTPKSSYNRIRHLD